MTATLTQARDEIHAAFKAAWEASVSYPVLYRDISNKDSKIPESGPWARLTVRHTVGGAAAIGGPSGSRRFRHYGIVTVQIFTEFGEGQRIADELTTIAKNAFEGEVTSPGRVIFRDVRINEVGQDEQWFQTNVLAKFEYDEVR